MKLNIKENENFKKLFVIKTLLSTCSQALKSVISDDWLCLEIGLERGFTPDEFSWYKDEMNDVIYKETRIVYIYRNKNKILTETVRKELFDLFLSAEIDKLDIQWGIMEVIDNQRPIIKIRMGSPLLELNKDFEAFGNYVSNKYKYLDLDIMKNEGKNGIDGGRRIYMGNVHEHICYFTRAEPFFLGSLVLVQPQNFNFGNDRITFDHRTFGLPGLPEYGQVASMLDYSLSIKDLFKEPMANKNTTKILTKVISSREIRVIYYINNTTPYPTISSFLKQLLSEVISPEWFTNRFLDLAQDSSDFIEAKYITQAYHFKTISFMLKNCPELTFFFEVYYFDYTNRTEKHKSCVLDLFERVDLESVNYYVLGDMELLKKHFARKATRSFRNFTSQHTNLFNDPRFRVNRVTVTFRVDPKTSDE